MSAEEAQASEPHHKLPLRALLAAVGAWFCFFGFWAHDPWGNRDGVWLLHLLRALPWFILTPAFAITMRWTSSGPPAVIRGAEP